VSNFEQTEVAWSRTIFCNPFTRLSFAHRKGCFMRCALCKSGKQAEFTSEMMIHFSGFKHLAKPGVLVFPKVLVCLDCGSSRFTTPETELRVLGKGIAVSAAA
jgi:hypothetical protein